METNTNYFTGAFVESKSEEIQKILIILSSFSILDIRVSKNGEIIFKIN
jgi:hypothetical protein